MLVLVLFVVLPTTVGSSTINFNTTDVHTRMKVYTGTYIPSCAGRTRTNSNEDDASMYAAVSTGSSDLFEA